MRTWVLRGMRRRLVWPCRRLWAVFVFVRVCPPVLAVHLSPHLLALPVCSTVSLTPTFALAPFILLLHHPPTQPCFLFCTCLLSVLFALRSRSEAVGRLGKVPGVSERGLPPWPCTTVCCVYSHLYHVMK